MEQKFVPPLLKEDFIKRAEPISEQAAKQILNALNSRRARMVEAIDVEIEFYENVIKYRKTGDVVWPPKKAGK